VAKPANGRRRQPAPKAGIKALLDKGRPDDACAAAEAAVRARPRDPHAWNGLGVALRALGRPEAAVAAYARGIALAPHLPSLHSNLGNAWRDLGRFDDAVAAHRAALALTPDHAGTWTNLAVALRDATRYEEALHAFERSLQLAPDNASVRFDRGQVLLMLGRYEEGWRDFEARLSLPDFRSAKLSQPRWDGSQQPAATLLLWPEQGFGDTILCARFIAAARRRVGRVVAICKPELMRLFATVAGIDELVPLGAAIPSYDVHAPLMSLPRFFIPRPSAIAPPVQMTVSPDAVRKMAALIPDTGILNVGIVWSGSVTFKGNRQRAATLDRFLPLAANPNLHLFSLQKGEPAKDIAALRATAVVTDLAPHLKDFADTAAAVARLDLVVMTDSSVAHLAGSLGRPVWNLLPHMPYWLYGPSGTATPWYPSMRLFRQPANGDWSSVFERVAPALAELAATPERRGRAITSS